MNRAIISVVVTGCLAAQVLAAPRKAQFQNAFEYSWSRAAQMVIYATISSIEVIDDPSQPASFTRVTLRVDSLQRGDAGHGNIDVRIDDSLSYSRENTQVGKHGLWFLHRITKPAGKNPQAHLIRYMNSSEISRDLKYTDELMQFVLQDTIDQSVKTDVLRDIEPTNRLHERHVELALKYDGKGGLVGIEVEVPSGNILFDDHVAEMITFMHRNLVYPDVLKSARIQITRQPRGILNR